MASTSNKKTTSLWVRFWRLLVILQKTLLGLFIFLPLLILVGAWLFRPMPEVERDTALVWAPQGILVEHVELDFQQALQDQLMGDEQPLTLVRDLVEALDRAAVDPRIKVLFLKVDEIDYVGMAQLEELAAAIQRFKLSGKPVFTHAAQYSQAQYFLASQADEIYLDPLGAVWVDGFGVYQQYFKEALDKLELDVHVFRVGTYKSAVEPFLRNDMSTEAKAANREWLSTLWKVYQQHVTEARKLPAEAVDDYANDFSTQLVALGGDSAQLAMQAGLVDKLMTREEMRARVSQEVGRDDDHGSFRQIDHRRYLWSVRSEDRSEQDKNPKGEVALIVAEGTIVDGFVGQGTVSGEDLAYHIEKARRDEDVKAIVLRIDSPGGSVTASEAIRREIQLVKRDGKPIVASMSSVAASGGYWIAMDADEIWSQATTVTGSIGVFGVMPNFYKPLQKLGIHTDGVGTTTLTGGLRPDLPLSADMAASVQATVENFYRVFVKNVASARGMSIEAAERVAQGRVWSGADAKRLGLVDQFGGLNAAADAAAKRAGLEADAYKLVPRQQAGDWRMLLLDQFSGFVPSLRSQNMNWWHKGLLWLQAQPTLKQLGFSWLSDPQGVHAHCLCVPDVNGRLSLQGHASVPGIQ